MFPVTYDTVIGVVAQSKFGVKYKDSYDIENRDLMVPDEIMKTLNFSSEDGSLVIDYINRTSMATAIASGMIALYMDWSSDRDIEQISNRVRTMNRIE